MPFHELTEEQILKAIEGYTNELEPELKKMEAFYRQFVCPQCKSGSLTKEYDPRIAFSDPNTLIARAILTCSLCGCSFDPHSGLILRMGNVAKLPPDIPIIQK